MAGTGVLTQPVVGLADIVCLINRLPHLAGEPVLSGSTDLFIPHLHGLPAGSTVDQPVEQVIEGAGVAFHNGWPAVNDFLHLFPFLTWDDVISVGADAFLMCPADKMCALIKWITQDMADLWLNLVRN